MQRYKVVNGQNCNATLRSSKWLRQRKFLVKDTIVSRWRSSQQLGALKKKNKNIFLAKGTKEGASVFKYMKHAIQFFTISIISVIHSNPLSIVPR
jgi:hypothetical protein